MNKLRTGVYYIEYVDGQHVRLTETQDLQNPGEPMRPTPTQSPITLGTEKYTSDSKFFKPSFILAVVGWLSVFAIVWLIMFGKVPPSSTNKFLLIMMLIVAVMASAVSGSKASTPSTGLIIKISDQIFTGDALTIHELKNGHLFVYVDLSKPTKPPK